MTLPNKAGEPEFKLKVEPADKIIIKTCLLQSQIFRVRPPFGFVKSGETAIVKISLKPKPGVDPNRHFFTIYHIANDDLNANPRLVWNENKKPDGIIRLQVSLEDETKNQKIHWKKITKTIQFYDDYSEFELVAGPTAPYDAERSGKKNKMRFKLDEGFNTRQQNDKVIHKLKEILWKNKMRKNPTIHDIRRAAYILDVLPMNTLVDKEFSREDVAMLKTYGKCGDYKNSIAPVFYQIALKTHDYFRQVQKRNLNIPQQVRVFMLDRKMFLSTVVALMMTRSDILYHSIINAETHPWRLMVRKEKTVKAQSVPPGDIQTQPTAKIVFNAPYDDKHTYHIKVINLSARRIGYGIKTTNMKRLGVDPSCGVLDPKEAVLLSVSCDAFAFGQEDTNNDRITVEWTNTPDGAAKQFRREWFQGDGMVRRKNLPIEYNP